MQVARRQGCRGQLKCIGTAVQVYEAENQSKPLIIPKRVSQSQSYQRLIFLGMLDNSNLLRCQECLSEKGRTGTFVQEDFATGSGSSIEYNDDINESFKESVDYSFMNKQITPLTASTSALAADGYRAGEKDNFNEGHNHINYGSILHKGGDVIGIAEPRWWIKIGEQSAILSDKDTGLNIE